MQFNKVLPLDIKLMIPKIFNQALFYYFLVLLVQLFYFLSLSLHELLQGAGKRLFLKHFVATSILAEVGIHEI